MAMEPETVRSRLAQKLREAAALRERMLRARLDAQQLRIRLLTLGVADTRVVPGQISAGAGASAPADAELRSLLEWLAEAADLTQQAQFECGSGAPIAVGGRRVVLQAMCAVPLRGGGAPQLQLSVPRDMSAELADVLAGVRRRGGKASDADVARIADGWEIVGAEMVSAAGRPEPAIFLVRRPGAGEGEAAPVPAMIVAQWPSVDFAALAEASAFDAGRHFQGLAPTRAEARPPPQESAAAQETPEAGARVRGCGGLGAEGAGETAPLAPPEESQKTTKVWEASPRHVLRHVRSRTVG